MMSMDTFSSAISVAKACRIKWEVSRTMVPSIAWNNIPCRRNRIRVFSTCRLTPRPFHWRTYRSGDVFSYSVLTTGRRVVPSRSRWNRINSARWFFVSSSM